MHLLAAAHVEGLAGDVRGPHRRVEVVVNDREGAGIGVVDADLLGRELVLDQVVFDTSRR